MSAAPPLFSGGIDARLEAVAAKYVGGTGYVPREGDVVVDVGAGIGEFTLWCADAGARVVAFEPDPLAFACLEQNTAALAGVQIFPYALWKERTQSPPAWLARHDRELADRGRQGELAASPTSRPGRSTALPRSWSACRSSIS